MAIADQLIFRVLPQAGQTQITNHLNGQTATGTGTPTLIDIGAEKAWSVAAGTLLNIPIPSTAITGDNGITIAIRARVTNFGTLSAQNFMGVNSAAGASLFESAHIRRNSTANNLAARYATGLIVNPSTVTFLNTVVTMISETEMSSVSSQDFGRVWVTGGGATEPNPDFSSTAGNGNATTVANFYINCSDGAAYEILDIAVFSGELTDAENWSLRQDIRAALPPAGGGSDVDPPTFTVAPAASAIGQTSATITATINETGSIFWVAVPQGDATPSVAQVIAGQNAAGSAPIDAGSAAATTSLSEVASGFTTATPYKFCVVAQDDEPTPNVQAAVTVVNFTTASAGDTTPPVFTVAPAVTSVSQTTATVSATIDETGSIFWVVVPNAEATPSVAQVIAGQNAAGGAPTDAGSAVGTTTLSEGVTGMTASTAYKACFVARDDEGVPNVQATVTTVGFTTAAVPTGTFTTGVLRRLVGGAPLVNTAMTYFRLYNPTNGALVLNRTDLSSDANGRVTCTDAALTAGVEYKADWLAATGETRMSKKAAT